MDRLYILSYVIWYILNAHHAFELTILHTNDVHSRFEQINRFGGECSSEDAQANNCFGGVARRHTKVKEIRSTGRNVLLLDGGDQFQGTIWYSYYQGAAAAHFTNLIGYDVGTIGTHELDDGTEVLSQYLRNLTYPIVSCNIDATNLPNLTSQYTSSVVLDVGGETVGVIGYITTKARYLVSAEHIIFTDIIDCLKEEVQILKLNGVNKIIALGYAEYSRNIEIAEQVDGIDVIVGGHTNTFMYTGNAPSNDEPVSKYPHVVTKSNNSTVYIVYAYAFGKYLGNLDITFDGNGLITHAYGNPILLDGNIEQDPYILREVKEWAEPLIELKDTAIGVSYVELNASCRTKECNLGNLVADAVLHIQLLQTPEKGGPWTKASVAVINGGAIRAAMHQGEIKLGKLMEVLPFRNEIAGFMLQGKYIKEMLENSVSRIAGLDSGVGYPPGRFLQMTGLRVKYDLSKAPGYRVKTVLIRCSDCAVPVYHPLDMDKKYGLVSITYLLSGGDEYDVLSEHAEDIIQYGFTLMESTKKYIESYGIVTHGEEGKIEFVSPGDYPMPVKPSNGHKCQMSMHVILSACFLILCIYMYI